MGVKGIKNLGILLEEKKGLKAPRILEPRLAPIGACFGASSAGALFYLSKDADPPRRVGKFFLSAHFVLDVD